MTTHGEFGQIEAFVRCLSGFEIPIPAVLGNHDHEAGQSETLTARLNDAGVRVLDGDAVEIGGIGFAGLKGFGGRFSRHALATFGEDPMKAFVRGRDGEELKLERALSKLRTPTKVVLLHYSPIAETMGMSRRRYGHLSARRGCFIPSRSTARVSFSTATPTSALLKGERLQGSQFSTSHCRC